MDKPTDPFAPLLDTQPAGTSSQEGDISEIWEPQLPAPCDPPELGKVPRWHGRNATRRSLYKGADGTILFAVYRYPGDEDKKDDIPYTFGRRVWTDKQGRQHDETGWHFKRPRSPLPLYGLPGLTAMPDAVVLIVEGEKTADAARVIFPNLILITSQGGAKNGRHADWEPLRGRDVIIWPDHDQPGLDYAEMVGQKLQEIGASIQRVSVPESWPQGWDLADHAPDGVNLQEVLDAAVRILPKLDLPPGYHMDKAGLRYTPPASNGKSATPVWLCPLVTVVCETDDGDGNAHGIVLQWRDRRKRLHQRVVPRSASDPKSGFINELMDAGLLCNPGRDAQSHLCRFFGRVTSSDWRRTVNCTGWHEVEGQSCFVLSNTEAIGPSRNQVILASVLSNSEVLYAGAGTLQEWQENVARFAIGNDRLAFAISAAHSGPLLEVMREDSGGAHLFGNSQAGKTTLLFAGASVWGKGAVDGGFVRTWRATGNGMEVVASAHNGTFLPLDEIGMVNGKEVGEIVYSLANQSGKVRARRYGGLQKTLTWKVVFFSTGEVTLADKMKEQGIKTMAGQEVRLVSLPADAGAGLGVFQQLHGMSDAPALANHLRKAAMTYYGSAGRAFLHALTQELAGNPKALKSEIAEAIDEFVRHNVPPGSAGQVISVARRFGLFAAAGELATYYHVLPWPDGEATRAAAACFQAWLTQRGGGRPAEEMQAIAAVKLFLELHGTSRFTEIGQNLCEIPSFGEPNWTDPRPVANRAGWRKREGEEWIYIFSDQVWQEQVCKGFQPNAVVQELKRLGYLVYEEGRTTKQHRIPGEGRGRFVTVRGSIVGGAA